MPGFNYGSVFQDIVNAGLGLDGFLDIEYKDLSRNEVSRLAQRVELGLENMRKESKKRRESLDNTVGYIDADVASIAKRLDLIMKHLGVEVVKVNTSTDSFGPNTSIKLQKVKKVKQTKQSNK